MESIRHIRFIIILAVSVSFITCFAPAELSAIPDQLYNGIFSTEMIANGVTDISACQSGCRMRYGPPPPTLGIETRTLPAISMVENPTCATAKTGGAEEYSSPAQYFQCMQECERNYWSQFEEDTQKSKRRR